MVVGECATGICESSKPSGACGVWANESESQAKAKSG